MKYLWKDIDKITTLFKHESPKLILLDFDGTLAPIVDWPEKAKLPEETKQILKSLSEKENFYLGVISGRELSDIKTKIGIPNIIYGGNHGLQGEILNHLYSCSIAEKFTRTMKKIRKELKVLEEFKGVSIEDKEFVLSLHYRRADVEKVPEILKAAGKILDKYRKNKLISLTEGKKVIDIMPALDRNKGDFANIIIERIKKLTNKNPLVLVMGDDKTDELMFEDLKNYITVVTGNNISSKARYYLRNYKEVADFLKKLNSF